MGHRYKYTGITEWRFIIILLHNLQQMEKISQDPMSSLTVILSSLNCDLKTDTKPNTCPMKLSRSSCNNKKFLCNTNIHCNLTGKLHVAWDAVSNKQQDLFFGGGEWNKLLLLNELKLISPFKEKRKKKTIHISIYFTHYITCKLLVTKQKLLGVGLTKSF